jgi:hypothetical protein
MDNKIVYDRDFYVTEDCGIHGVVFKLTNSHQKKVWLDKMSERDKVFLIEKENTLVGVCKDTSRIIAYIHTDLGDLAFCSDAVMQSGRFKSSLLEEDLAPYADWQLCVTPDAELIANNQFDLYNDKSLYIDGPTAASIIGVDLDDISSLYKGLIEESLYYLPDAVQEWIADLDIPSRQDHFYLYEAFGLSMDNDDEVLHAAEWYEPQVVASRLIKAYTNRVYSKMEDESYTILCKERVRRAREERRAARHSSAVAE